MDREHQVCPACGQPVDTVVRRHKTLGAWVPRWVPGPCHNPECEAYVEPGAERHGHSEHHGHTEHHDHPEQQHDRPGPVEEAETPASPAS
ncbi:hypothetical protein ACIBBD_23175 [Streptomyces sp. NPDC051315]|uniref:hypothetical protein n=1 Tax=Streptomyces sp. NPDC051315 TaxID=3365650 RepID=UPI003794BF17